MEQAPQDPDRHCQHCGTALADETTGGLCPRCLLEMNFASRTMPGGEPSPQIPPPTPGEMAARFPQFEILECLGRGGMGIVYKARQKSLNRLVAIKVLAPERVGDAKFAGRFSQEAEMLAKMSHPNIVTVFDHGESEGLFYIVMEFVDGVNLRDLLREGKIEPEQALAIVPPICEALEYAHDKGVVHRDIKPENLLLDRDGRVKIADFGIAALIGADADHSGTPPYMAPEQQAGGGTIDRRADIYALGAVLYEMLTGERPDKDLVAPSKRVEIDVRLDEIVLRALEKEPARRYQTAGEFRTVVQTLTDTAGKQPSGSPIDRKPTNRGRTMADILAVVMGGGALRSRVASHLANASALGFLAFLSFLQWLPGMQWIQSFKGFAGFFGLFGVASLFEMIARHQAKASASTAEPLAAASPSRPRRIRFAVIIGLFIAAVAALFFWAQQPRMIDERTIAADSPDEMFSAMGQTYHAMRIFDSDRTFYRFQVQGRAGAVFESWEVPVPYGKLATSYVLLSRDEILFGKHGMIVWSDDGKRVSFQVMGIEVAGFDTETGKPMEPREGQKKVLQPSPRFSEWQGYTLHDLESGRKDGSLNLSRGHMDTLTEERWRTEGVDALLTVEFASAGMALAVGGAMEFHLVEVGKEVARDPQRVVQFLQDSVGMMPEDGHEIIDDEGGIFHVLPQDGKGRTYAYAVGMPQGLPVAGLIEIGQADRAAETLQIRHRGLEDVVADLPAETQRIRDRVHTTDVFEENTGALIERTLPGSDGNDEMEHAARAFMEAVLRSNYDKAAALTARPLDRKEFDNLNGLMKRLFEAAPERMTDFVEFYREGAYAVVRIASPPGRPGLSQALILEQSGETWRVLAGPFPTPTSTSSAEELKRVRSGFQHAESGAPGPAEAEALPPNVQPVFPTDARQADPINRSKLHYQEAVNSIVQGLMGLRHKHPELVRFAEDARHQVEVLDGATHVSLVYAYNYDGDNDGGTKTKAAGPSDASQPWCHIALDIHPLDAEPKHVPHGAEKAIQWNGKATVRHYRRSGSGLFVGVAVRTGSDALRVEVNRIIDRELNALIRTDSDEARKTPEDVARNFMTAIRDGDIDAAMKWIAPEVLRAHVGIRKDLEGMSKTVDEAYAGKLDRLTEFTEWYPQNPDANTRFVGARVAGGGADNGTGRLHGLYLILSPTPEGWKVAHLDDASSDKPLSHYVDRISVQRLPVTAPDAMPDDSPLSVEQLKQILAGVTWSEFITAFADDGRGNEVSWKKVESKGNEGHRYEIGFPLGGERMLLDLAVDPEFQHAVPSRVRPARNPEQVKAEASEFMPVLVMRYAMKSGHPAAAPAIAELRERALQAKDLGTLREYVTALLTYQLDAGSLPPNLEVLVGKKFLRELLLMENHATGNKEKPLYHGSPELLVEEFDASKWILLAAPSSDKSGKRAVGFLDGSVKVIDEAEYQKRLKWQQKPPMERAVDAFLESCARKGITDNKQLFDELGMGEFIERYGDGERAMREHHDKLPAVLQFAISKTTGDLSPAFVKHLREVHRNGDPRLARQAGLLLEMLKIPLSGEATTAPTKMQPQSERPAEPMTSPEDMLLAHARALEGDFAVLEQTWEVKDDLERRVARILAEAFARAEGMTVELVSMQGLNENSIFACYLMRNGPQWFGAAHAPLFITFHRRGERWQCALPAHLLTMMANRTMGTGQIGRRALAEQLVHQRFGHSDPTARIAMMKATRDAMVRLARPPHNLTEFRAAGESLTKAIQNGEEAESWQDLLHKLIKEQPKEALPGPGDFFVSFYLEGGPDAAHGSREFPIAGEEGTFTAEIFPCMTDHVLREARVGVVPGSERPQIEIDFTKDGARLFESVTRQSIGKRLACVVDGKVISAPEIMTSIEAGKAVVAGSFSRAEAEVIAKKMNTYRGLIRQVIADIEKEEKP